MTAARESVVSCGPLDVDDVSPIPTGRIPDELIQAALHAAVESPLFDGEMTLVGGSGERGQTWMTGPATVAKVKHRQHERLESLLWFHRGDLEGALPIPALLDLGEVEDSFSEPAWWVVIERSLGQEAPTVTRRRQSALAGALANLHDLGEPKGLRLDDPGAAGVYLGTARAVVPELWKQLAGTLDRLCRGAPMVAIHGDVAVTHNALFADEELDAVIDPGAVHVGPRELDLAWAFAVDLPHGGELEPLLDAYPAAFDRDLLEALLPTVLTRRLVDLYMLDRADGAQIIREEIGRRSPPLLADLGLVTNPLRR